MTLKPLRTETLDVAYEEGGPQDGPVVLLLHGWPDDVRGWSGVTPHLHAAGFRTLTPYLRGFGPTRFLSDDTPRDGRAVVLVQDALDLLDALEVPRCAVVGHDWGARAAYTFAALFPERLSSIAALSLGYQPGGQAVVPAFPQARLFWYQWFMTLGQGGDAVRADPVGFARIQWDTWSPPGWFGEEEFRQTALSFRSPDWPEVTLSSYRSRWHSVRPEDHHHDARYDDLQQRLSATRKLGVPTLTLHGAADTCVEPASSEGLDDLFTGGYRRVLLGNVGHFPAREAPDAVAQEVLAHLNAHRS